MTIAQGAEEYNVDSNGVVARGRSHTSVQVDNSLRGCVGELVRDAQGKALAVQLVASLSTTGFKQKHLAKMLDDGATPKDWEVGEAYAQAYLAKHKRCKFPWAGKWDEKKAKSSLPGADLVGFEKTDQKQFPTRFAFGEVKTSGEKKWPPQVVTKKGDGLKQQLLDLRDVSSIQKALIRYLMRRAIGATWEADWQSAFARVSKNIADVSIFGVILRDVSPNQKDLELLAKTLANGKPTEMCIELLAIYLPAGSKAKLADYYTTKTKKSAKTKAVKNAKKKSTTKKKGGK